MKNKSDALSGDTQNWLASVRTLGCASTEQKLRVQSRVQRALGLASVVATTTPTETTALRKWFAKSFLKSASWKSIAIATTTIGLTVALVNHRSKNASATSASPPSATTRTESEMNVQPSTTDSTMVASPTVLPAESAALPPQESPSASRGIRSLAEHAPAPELDTESEQSVDRDDAHELALLENAVRALRNREYTRALELVEEHGALPTPHRFDRDIAFIAAQIACRDGNSNRDEILENFANAFGESSHWIRLREICQP